MKKRNAIVLICLILAIFGVFCVIMSASQKTTYVQYMKIDVNGNQVAPSEEDVQRWCGYHDCYTYPPFDPRANID